MKKNLLFPLVLASTLLPLSSCGGEQIDPLRVTPEAKEAVEVTDSFRSMYEIFPYAFADSNGDGIGDLQGILDKFDYIKSLNVNGLWLTPVHQSGTYHKYDVDDYKSIDRKFGTIDTYDALVSKCHENKMTIILDLVLNHSSSSHPWFKACMEAHINGDYSSPYYDYYNIEYVPSGVPTGYARYGNSEYVYECRFWSGMPDLNLQAVLDDTNCNLANDIRDILRFWLTDHQVDGFRLDAVTSYFTNNSTKNIEFLSWLNQECKAIKSDCYIVGECWEGSGTIKSYYSSGIDSFFQFEDSQGEGYYSKAVVNADVTSFATMLTANKATALNGVAAPFIANHDMIRAIGPARGRSNLNNAKMIEGLLSLSYGCTYLYYGDELGMASSGNVDQDHRQPVPWGDSYKAKPAGGSTDAEDSQKYIYGTVASQEQDENSLLNYVKKANRIRLENPELARGTAKLVYKSTDKSFGIIEREYQGDKIYIALNLGMEEATFSPSSYGNGEILAALAADSSTYLRWNSEAKDTLILPASSYAIIH